MTENPVETLVRWEAAGGVWRLLSDDGDHVVVGLFSCDGGEEMDRVVSSDQGLRNWLGR